MHWQPIETAPKDGTRIILGKVNGPVWADCCWREMRRVPSRWESFVGAIPFTPTHWMPLPDPPTDWLRSPIERKAMNEAEILRAGIKKALEHFENEGLNAEDCCELMRMEPQAALDKTR